MDVRMETRGALVLPDGFKPNSPRLSSSKQQIPIGRIRRQRAKTIEFCRGYASAGGNSHSAQGWNSGIVSVWRRIRPILFFKLGGKILLRRGDGAVRFARNSGLS